MASTNKPMQMQQVFHSCSSSLNVVTTLFLFAMAFVLGMVSNASFPQFSVAPFLQQLPSFTRLAMPPATPPASSPPETPCTTVAPTPLPSPRPTTPSPPSSPERPRRMGFADFLAAPGGSDSVMHNMTDEELLWRASMAPRVTARTPRGVVPKVAFLFLAKGELPLRPLWEKFFAGHHGLYSIYVHTSPSYAGSPPADSVFHGRMIPSQRTGWGDLNLVDAERRLVANALLDLSNAAFVLLSESCIPLLSFPAVHAHLTGANTSFVDCYDRPDGRARYNTYFGGHNITLARWRKGAQWFEMDRPLALELVSDETYLPVFRGADARGLKNMEEHYVPTLLSMLGWGARNANRTLTYADWRGGGPHPRSHRAGDVTEELLRGMRRGVGDAAYLESCGYNGGGLAADFCFAFARKFSPDALGKLLELAPKVMGFG